MNRLPQKKNSQHSEFGLMLFDRIIINAIMLIGIMMISVAHAEPTKRASGMQRIELPQPKIDGNFSLEKALSQRRSNRDFHPDPLTLAEISQLLWAAQGITSTKGLRTTPSAGALYPLELYLVAANVSGLAVGVYRYLPHTHQLVAVTTGDQRRSLAAAALGQGWLRKSAAIVVFAAVFKRTTVKYEKRGKQYVYIKTGHAAQNLALQATALNLGAVTVGAFHDHSVKRFLHMKINEQPLYLMPLGRLAESRPNQD